MHRPLSRRAVVVAVNLVVAAMHLVTGPAYRGPLRGFVTGYLMDVALPFALVLLLGLGFERVAVLHRAAVRAGLVVALGVGIELAQCRGVALFGRTCDALDLLAYGSGALGAVLLERLGLVPTAPSPGRS